MLYVMHKKYILNELPFNAVVKVAHADVAVHRTCTGMFSAKLQIGTE